MFKVYNDGRPIKLQFFRKPSALPNTETESSPKNEIYSGLSIERFLLVIDASTSEDDAARLLGISTAMLSMYLSFRTSTYTNLKDTINGVAITPAAPEQTPSEPMNEDWGYLSDASLDLPLSERIFFREP